MPSTFFGDEAALVHVGEHAIEGNHAVASSSRSICAGDFLNLLLGERLEVGFHDLHVREADQPLGERHLRVGFELDGADRRFVGGLATM